MYKIFAIVYATLYIPASDSPTMFFIISKSQLDKNTCANKCGIIGKLICKLSFTYSFFIVNLPLTNINIPQPNPNTILKKSTPIILPKYLFVANTYTKIIDSICDTGDTNKLYINVFFALLQKFQ